jgi:hypothetical protein
MLTVNNSQNIHLHHIQSQKLYQFPKQSHIYIEDAATKSQSSNSEIHQVEFLYFGEPKNKINKCETLRSIDSIEQKNILNLSSR